MMKKIAKLPIRARTVDPKQGELAFGPEAQFRNDGIGMGVLEDGTPFLTQRAIADLCGVENRYIGLISSGWNAQIPSKEVAGVKELLFESGVVNIPDLPHFEVSHGSRTYFAYPAVICTALLEYFAFQANRQGAPIALSNYRKLTRKGIESYVYEATGYRPKVADDAWKIFKDRMRLNNDAVPTGFFGIFREIADLIFTLGEEGLHIDENFVPDISVGGAWSNHWQKNKLGDTFGERKSYPHLYPEYFPQSAANPHYSRCYPESALGEFRRWFREDYIGEGRLRNYLKTKVTQKLLSSDYVENVVRALMKPDSE